MVSRQIVFTFSLIKNFKIWHPHIDTKNKCFLGDDSKNKCHHHPNGEDRLRSAWDWTESRPDPRGSLWRTLNSQSIMKILCSVSPNAFPTPAHLAEILSFWRHGLGINSRPISACLCGLSMLTSIAGPALKMLHGFSVCLLYSRKIVSVKQWRKKLLLQSSDARYLTALLKKAYL